LVAIYFPFVQFLSGVADAIVLGVGAGLIASGHLTRGALIAFILYIDMFFSPIQQLSQVFDSWQQTRVSVGRISELMQMETLTPQADAIVPGRLRGEIASTTSASPTRWRSVAARIDRGRPAERRGPEGPASPGGRRRRGAEAPGGPPRHRSAYRRPARRWRWWARRGRASRRS
jgi:ATP-binding cassette subfamily B protein